jgi:hypothetical protein
MAPPLDAVLSEIVELLTVRVALPNKPFWMAPPVPAELLLERVELVMVTVPLSMKMAPPLLDAVLPERVELETLRVPLFKMAPPRRPEFPERVELVSWRVPWLRIPPPAKPAAVFVEMVELLMYRPP